jgi:predicted ATP-dependent endonuclease of OLD family
MSTMMYHFTQFNIHQFRGFRHFSFDNLGRVNLLVGMNNSGKTSVLEAISLTCRSLDSMEWFATASRRGIRQSFASPVIEALKWLFPQNRENGEIIMVAQGNFEVREVRATLTKMIAGEAVLPVITDLEPAIDETDFNKGNEEHGKQGLKIKVVRQLHSPDKLDQLYQEEQEFEWWENERFVRPQQTIEHTLPVSIIMPFSHRIESIQIRQITRAKTEGTIEQVLNLIQRIDPNIEDLEILSSDGTRAWFYLQHKEIGLAPLNIFGEGIQRILAIALSLSSVQNGVLLIEELEAGIHTSALKTVFSWLVEACRDYNVQLFATTHSLEALDAVLATVPDNSDEIVSYRLPNPLAGEKLKRFGGNLLHRLRYERGLDVR